MKIKIPVIAIFSIIIVLTLSTCDLDGFGPPKGLQVMKLTSTNSIHLTWDGVTGAVGYDIIYRTNLDSKSTQRTLTTGCTITAYDDSIRFNSDITAVYYSVRAYKYTKDSNNNTTRKDSDYCAAVVIYSN